MTVSVRDKEIKERRAEQQTSPSETIYERTYTAGQGATLATMDLERGDALPDNASAEIIKSWIETDRKAGRVARVVARQARAES